MSTRILLVDDDPHILAAYQRTLWRSFESDAVKSGAEALVALATRGPYAVIVVDMRMPGLSGLALLVEAQRRAPNTVRIMLTGAEDQKTAADAVNAGRVFRFLHKPCSADTFLSAIREAVEQHQFARREREVLEQTFNGIVQMLTDVLGAAEPDSFGIGQRMRDRARAMGQAMKLSSTWELESAAMLFRVGMVTIPGPLLAKWRNNQTLSAAESEIIQRVPDVGARLLANIPRLAPVAEIVRFQAKGYDGTGLPDDKVAGADIPIGARILRPLLDLQALLDGGTPMVDALVALQSQAHLYDPDVLKALAGVIAEAEGTDELAIVYLPVSELHPGMILAADAFSNLDFPLVKAGTTLSPMLLERLRNFADLGQVREPLTVIPVRKKKENRPDAPDRELVAAEAVPAGKA